MSKTIIVGPNVKVQCRIVNSCCIIIFNKATSIYRYFPNIPPPSLEVIEKITTPHHTHPSSRHLQLQTYTCKETFICDCIKYFNERTHILGLNLAGKVSK